MPLNTNIWADRERTAPWTGPTQATSRQIQLANENADEYLKERRGLGTVSPGTEKSFDATGNLLSTTPVTSPATRGLMTSSNSIDETGKGYSVNYMDASPDYRGAGLAQPPTRSLPATTAPTPSTPFTSSVVAQPGARDVELLRRLDQVDTTGALPPGVKSTMGATRSYTEPTTSTPEDMYPTLYGLGRQAGEAMRHPNYRAVAEESLQPPVTKEGYSLPPAVKSAGEFVLRHPALYKPPPIGIIEEILQTPQAKKAGRSLVGGYSYGLGQ
jgi:hypothetical protein